MFGFKHFWIIFVLCLIPFNSAFSLKQWEKDVYENTKNVKRIPAETAYQMYLTGKSFLASVDPVVYYKQYRLIEGINFPWKDFTEKFIKRNLSKFKKYKYIIIY